VPELLSAIVTAAESGWQPPTSLVFIAVGGARVAPWLIDAAHRHGLPVYEGYGLSECSSVVCLNTPRAAQVGSVGRPLPHLQLSIQAGEIVVSGSSFLGYANDPESWQQGELATGDLGSIDNHGFVSVEGRSGNRFCSSFGRNISPEWVESELLAGPVLAQAVVVGDGQPWCAALLYPQREETSEDEITAWVDTVNQRLPDYARIGRWHRLAELMTQHNQLATANGRPRRHAVQERLAVEIAALYANGPGG